MAHTDIIIYALIAVVLLARLWVVFGRRNEDDQQRPNPFAAPAPNAHNDEGVIVRQARSSPNAPQSLAPMAVMAPMSLAGALERVNQFDSSFDEKQFLRDARKIFSDIVAAFAKGDLAPVKNRLGPAVLPHFQNAIDARVKAGETLENKITRMRDVEVSAARTDDKNAFITVRFISEQENILRDAAGAILSGGPGKIEEITDLWTFAHDPKAGWQLAETKS